MGNFRDYLNEARNTSVPTEFRIALGQLKRMYNAGEVPEKKELLKDIEMIAKKNHLDSDKFLEFALAQFKMNEADEDVSEAKMETAEFDKIINLLNTKRASQAKKEYNALSKTGKELFHVYLDRSKIDIAKDVKKMLGLNEDNDICEKSFNFRMDSLDDYTPSNDKDFLSAIEYELSNRHYNLDSLITKFGNDMLIYFKGHDKKLIPEIQKLMVKQYGKVDESAVGTPGRTTVKDAEDHINDELLAEFKKIIKKLGGKTVAKVLLDKLGQKVEIKDEIDHIEDIIDNSNY